MEYKKIKLKTAAERVIKKITNIKGSGGLISNDQKGTIVMEFNTKKQNEIVLFVANPNFEFITFDKIIMFHGYFRTV